MLTVSAVGVSDDFLVTHFSNLPDMIQLQLRRWLNDEDTYAPEWGLLRKYANAIAKCICDINIAVDVIDDHTRAVLYCFLGDWDNMHTSLTRNIDRLQRGQDIPHLARQLQRFYSDTSSLPIHIKHFIAYEYALSLLRSGKSDEGFPILKSTPMLALQAGDTKAAILYERTLGSVMVHRGNITQGNHRLQHALQLAQSTGNDFEAARTLVAIAHTHWHSNDHVSAYAANRDAYRIFQRLSDWEQAGIALMNMGELSSQLGEFERAEQHLKKALDYLDTSTGKQPVVWQFLADLYILQRRFSEAEYAIEQAISGGHRHLDMEFMLEQSRGLLSLRQGAAAAALEIWKKAIKTYTPLAHHQRLMIYAFLPQAYILVDDRVAAVEAAQLLFDVVEEAGAEPWQQQLAAIGVSYIVWHDARTDVFDSVVRCLYRLPKEDADVRAAFEHLLQTTSPVMSDSMIDTLGFVGVYALLRDYVSQYTGYQQHPYSRGSY